MSDMHEGGLMPKVFGKWAAAERKRSGVRVQFGAGQYEDKFRFYWLVAAWVFLGYLTAAMTIILYHMASGAAFVWMPQAVGTAIIMPAFTAIACVYRFILFPSPGYYSFNGGQEQLPEDRYYSSEPAAGYAPGQAPAPVRRPEGVAA